MLFTGLFMSHGGSWECDTVSAGAWTELVFCLANPTLGHTFGHATLNCSRSSECGIWPFWCFRWDLSLSKANRNPRLNIFLWNFTGALQSQLKAFWQWCPKYNNNNAKQNCFLTESKTRGRTNREWRQVGSAVESQLAALTAARRIGDGCTCFWKTSS